jgi:hypothetical protein
METPTENEFPYPDKIGSSKRLIKFEEECLIEWEKAHANGGNGFNIDCVMAQVEQKLGYAAQTEAEYNILKHYVVSAKTKFKNAFDEAKRNNGIYQVVKVESLTKPRAYIFEYKPTRKQYSRRENAKISKLIRKVAFGESAINKGLQFDLFDEDNY